MSKTETVISIITQIIGERGIAIKCNNELHSMLEQIGLIQYYNAYLEHNHNEEGTVLLALDYILNGLYLNNKQEEIILILKEIEKQFNDFYMKKYFYVDFVKFWNLYQYFGLNQMPDALQEQKETDKNSFRNNNEDIYEIYYTALSSYVNGNLDNCVKLCKKAIAIAFFNCEDIDSFETWLRKTFCNSNSDYYTSDKNTKGEFFKKHFIENYIQNNNERLTKSNLNHMIYLLISDCCNHEKKDKKSLHDDAVFMLRLTQNIVQWMY